MLRNGELGSEAVTPRREWCEGGGAGRRYGPGAVGRTAVRRVVIRVLARVVGESCGLNMRVVSCRNVHSYSDENTTSPSPLRHIANPLTRLMALHPPIQILTTDAQAPIPPGLLADHHLAPRRPATASTRLLADIRRKATEEPEGDLMAIHGRRPVSSSEKNLPMSGTGMRG